MSILILILVVTARSFPVNAISFSLPDFHKFTAEDAYYYTGEDASFGDINGDGRDDLLIGAPLYSSTGDPTVYLVYSKATKIPYTPSLSSSRVVKFTGEDSSDDIGGAIATGDVNGDGYDDILIGASEDDDAGTNAGAVYLVYGSSSKLHSINLADTSAVKLTGEASYDYTGDSVAMGDVNGDGYDDLLIGAPWNDDGGGTAGALYLIYGQSTDLSSMSLSDANVVEFTGDASDRTGRNLTIGDVNGDGYNDILTGSIRDDYIDGVYTPIVYLVYGQAADFSSMSLTDSSVVKFSGETTTDYYTGVELATGDMNGDGYDDFLTGVFGYSDVSTYAGISYLVYGQAADFSSMSLTDSSVVEFLGEDAYDYAGFEVASGDMNGDGYDDVLIGAHGNDDGGSSSGAVYVIHGQSRTLNSITLSDTDMMKFTGDTSDYAGYSIVVGDSNNDGYGDVLIGAIHNDDAGTYAGAAYLIFGGIQFRHSTSSFCGDGMVDTGEECDGSDLNGASCSTQGFSGGTLSCNSSCQFDTSACWVSGGGGGGGGGSGS